MIADPSTVRVERRVAKPVEWLMDPAKPAAMRRDHPGVGAGSVS
jgi:hypothetical protein